MSLLKRIKGRIKPQPAPAKPAPKPFGEIERPDLDEIIAKNYPQTTDKERAFLAQHFRHNAYPHQFDWNWRATPFNRMALVTYIASQIPDCAYLEIGCDQDKLFDAVGVVDKTGVDPRRGGTVRKTSDDFFATNTKKFDFIWVDGLHEYRQVHRDVVNAIAALKPGGFIGLHDMLPLNWKFEHVPRMNLGWTGDVWKVAFEIAATKGLDFKLVTIDHGCGVLQVTDPSATLVDLNHDIADQRFGYLYENIDKLPTATWEDTTVWINNALRAART